MYSTSCKILFFILCLCYDDCFPWLYVLLFSYMLYIPFMQTLYKSLSLGFIIYRNFSLSLNLIKSGIISARSLYNSTLCVSRVLHCVMKWYSSSISVSQIGHILFFQWHISVSSLLNH